jgi:hypothetical protein
MGAAIGDGSGRPWHATKTQIKNSARRPVTAEALIAATPHKNSVSPSDLSSSGHSARQIEPPARTACPNVMAMANVGGKLGRVDEIFRRTGRIGAEQVNDLPIEHPKARTNSTLARGVSTLARGVRG